MKNFTSLLLFTIILSLFSCVNNEPEESPEESYLKEVIIDSDFHLAHMGQITFMKDYVALSDYTEKHFISSVDLPLNEIEKVNLNFRAYLDNTLTNHLVDLAPEKSISDLVANGNYHFTFLVDGKKIYQEKLNSGAGSFYAKNQNTSLCVPLLSSTEEDSWGRFLWARFMSRGGGQEALIEGLHTLKIEIRPYVEFEEVKIGTIMAEGMIDLNVVDNSKPIDPKQLAIQAIASHEDWEISNIDVDTKLIQSLNEKIHKKTFKEVTSIIIIKDNKLLLEEYFNGGNRTMLHDTRSVGKSITSAILGVAITNNYIKDEEESLDKFYDLDNVQSSSFEKRNTTLKDLLTMTSAFEGNDEDYQSLGTEDNIQSSKNWMEYTLNLPTVKNRVTQKSWNYFTGGVMLLGDIINKSVPNGIEQFTQQKIFDPLNINSSKWFHTPQGLPYGGGGLQLNSLDLAKIGSLYVNEGKWNGQEIMNSNWIEKSLKNHVSLPSDRKGDYGYLWYNTNFDINGEKISCSFAAGNGGNAIYVFPDTEMIIVITAQTYNTMAGATQAEKMVGQFLLPAVI